MATPEMENSCLANERSLSTTVCSALCPTTSDQGTRCVRGHASPRLLGSSTCSLDAEKELIHTPL